MRTKPLTAIHGREFSAEQAEELERRARASLQSRPTRRTEILLTLIILVVAFALALLQNWLAAAVPVLASAPARIGMFLVFLLAAGLPALKLAARIGQRRFAVQLRRECRGMGLVVCLHCGYCPDGPSESTPKCPHCGETLGSV